MNKKALIGKLITFSVILILLAGAGFYYNLGKKESGEETENLPKLNVGRIIDELNNTSPNEENSTENETENYETVQVPTNDSNLNNVVEENISLNYTTLS